MCRKNNFYEMLHINKTIVDKTSFELNKSYTVDLSAEMMIRAEFCTSLQPETASIVGFARHPTVIFVVGRGDPRRAEQRQAGEEIEEGHQA